MAKHNRQWLERQSKDPFVKKARQSDQRSRAIFKLEEIDRKDKLFHPGQVVVDLGAAPGSWSQYVRDKVGARGRVLSVDLLEMKQIPDVFFIKGDFTEETTYQACLDHIPSEGADLVISDMSPNISGIKSADHARSMRLVESVYEFACRVLKPKGTMLVKVFQGEGIEPFKSGLSQCFQKVMVRKPRASRDSSREFYILAKNYVV